MPPPFATSDYHSLQVYFQIIQWKEEDVDLNPQEWGWDVVDGRYLQRQTDNALAPPELLKMVEKVKGAGL